MLIERKGQTMTFEMQYVYEVFKQGSFSKAAEKLCITQPALSIAVKKVEEDLGLPIFNRHSKPIQLTNAGIIYIGKIEQIRNLEKELRSEINDINNLAVGSINIAGTNYINSHVLPIVISQYIKKFPGIKISLIESDSSNLHKLLDDDEIDITFICGDINAKKYNIQCVFKDTLILAVPTNYVTPAMLPFSMDAHDLERSSYTRKKCLDINHLRTIPFIILRKQNNLHLRSLKIFEQAGIEPVIIQELDQLVTAYYFCSQGIGATFVSSFLATSEHLDGIKYFKVNSTETTRSFYSVTKKNSYIPIAVKEFISLFSQIYGQIV